MNRMFAYWTHLNIVIWVGKIWCSSQHLLQPLQKFGSWFNAVVNSTHMPLRGQSTDIHNKFPAAGGRLPVLRAWRNSKVCSTSHHKSSVWIGMGLRHHSRWSLQKQMQDLRLLYTADVFQWQVIAIHTKRWQSLILLVFMNRVTVI